MNNVLIIGGLGFIGNTLTRQFLKNKWNVIVVDNCTTYDEYEPILHAAKIDHRLENIRNRIMYYRLDIMTDVNLLADIFTFHSPDIVINLANVPDAKIVMKNPIKSTPIMTTGLLQLLEFANDNQVGRFVNISSSMVYGDFLIDPVSESQECNPQNIYGNLKMIGERLVRSYTKMYGLEHTIIRPSACYGPTGNESFVITKFIRAAKQNRKLVIHGANVSLDFTYVSDLAVGIFLAATMDAGTNKTFNITAGQKRKLTDVGDILQSMYPSTKMKIIGPNQLYPIRGQLSINKAEDLLGYSPRIKIEQGLKRFNDHLTLHNL